MEGIVPEGHGGRLSGAGCFIGAAELCDWLGSEVEAW